MLMPHSSRSDWKVSLFTYWLNHWMPRVLAPRSWNGMPCASITVGADSPSVLPTESLPCLPYGVSAAVRSVVDSLIW